MNNSNNFSQSKEVLSYGSQGGQAILPQYFHYKLAHVGTVSFPESKSDEGFHWLTRVWISIATHVLGTVLLEATSGSMKARSKFDWLDIITIESGLQPA